MELCPHCGNPTAGDVTGTLYCVVCGEKVVKEEEQTNG